MMPALPQPQPDLPDLAVFLRLAIGPLVLAKEREERVEDDREHEACCQRARERVE
jgi:hypothetical protein